MDSGALPCTGKTISAITNVKPAGCETSKSARRGECNNQNHVPATQERATSPPERCRSNVVCLVRT